MATLNVPYNGVNAPGAASFTPPQIDTAAIANWPKDFYGGQQAQHQLDVQNAFKGGLPLDANGNPDFQAGAMKLIQMGQPDQAAQLMQMGINQQAFAAARQELGTPLPGAAPAASSNAASPVENTAPASQGDFKTINSTIESGGDPHAHNPDEGPPGTAAYGIIGFMPKTWAHLVSAHPDLGLPTDITKSTLDDQQKAERAYTQENTGYLAQHGVAITDRTARMANFLGAGGAVHFFHALNQNGGALAAPMFPAEAKANPDAFYNPGPNGKPDLSSPRTLGQVLQYEVVTYPMKRGLPPIGNGNTTGFDHPVAPRNQVAGPGAPSQPTQPTPVVARATPAPVYANPAENAFAGELAAQAAAHGGTVPGGAASPGSPEAAVAASYAQNLIRPPPTNQPAAQPVAPAPSPVAGSQAAGSPPAVGGQQSAAQPAPNSGPRARPPNSIGLLDPTFGGTVPPGVDLGAYANQLQRSGEFLSLSPVYKAMGEARIDQAKQIRAAIVASITSRSPAMQEYQLNAQQKPDGTWETPGETQTRMAGLQEQRKQDIATAAAGPRAAAEAAAKTNVELGTAGPIAEAKEQYETLGKLPGRLADTANAAALQNNMIEEMQGAAANFRMGWGADSAAHARSIIQGIGQMAGIDTSSMVDEKSLSNYTDFVKISGQLVRQATKETSPRAAFQEMEFIRKGMPGPETPEGGFNLVAPQMKALGDLSIAKQQAGAAWAQAHNSSYAGFEADWNKNVGPAAFTFHRLADENPQAYQQTIDNLKQQPGGKAMIRHVLGQVEWANEHGLFGE